MMGVGWSCPNLPASSDDGVRPSQLPTLGPFFHVFGLIIKLEQNRGEHDLKWRQIPLDR